MFIQVNDVIKRRDNLSSKIPVRESVNNPRLYDDKEEKFFTQNAVYAIENTRSLHEDYDKAVDKSIDIFYEMMLNGVNKSQLNTSFAIIMENVDRVRDANALINSIKHKNSRFKSKIGTKISNKIDAAKSAIGNTTQNIFDKLPKSATGGTVKAAIPADNKEEKQEESAYYTELIRKCKYISECDRILHNHEAISNRINLNECIDEESAYNTAANIANKIDKLEIPFINKFNSCLESTQVLLASKFIKYSPSDIINGATDYFLFNSKFYESDVNTLVNKSVLYNPSDFSGLYYSKPEVYKESSYGFDLDDYITDHQMFIENELAETLKKKGEDLKSKADKTVKDVKKATEEKDPEVKKDNKLHDMMQEFRSKASKEVDKDHKSAFKALLTKFFAGDAYHIANDMMTVFDILRATIIVGATVIHPVVGLLSFISDQILKIHFTRDQYEKVINAYKKEITKAVKKEKSLKDEKEKEKYQKYIELLKKDLEKIRNSNMGNYTDEENDNRDAYGYEDNYGEDVDTDDFGLDDSEWDIELEGAVDLMNSGINGLGKLNTRLARLVSTSDKDVSSKMINDFRDSLGDKIDEKDVISAKRVIQKYFGGTPTEIAYNADGIFRFLRTIIALHIFSGASILSLIILIGSIAARTKLNMKERQKVLKAYKKEIDYIKNKIKSSKGEDKTNYEKYLKRLEDDYTKINKDGIALEEDTVESVVSIADKLESISEGLIDKDIDGVICNNILKMDPNDLDSAIDFVVTVPDVIHEGEYKDRAEAERAVLRQNKDKDSALKVDKINDSLRKIKDMKKRNPDEEPLLSESLVNLSIINAMVNYNEQTLLEMDFSNTVKIALNNMKKMTTKLSDKEKEASRNLDATGEHISRGIEDAVKTNNREAVIKGKLIPSLSKSIKVALGLGVAWAVNPVIAMIGAIGGFICMKNMQDKERQLLLDDIEVEIKMCERYISKEEGNNNLKKVREYERLLRSLQRQQQRIKYKMNVEHNLKAPSADARPKGVEED